MIKTKSTFKSKILSLLTAFAMLASLLPVLPAGVTALADGTGDFTVTTSDGSYSYEDSLLTISAGGTYTISQTDDTVTTDTIAVTADDTVIINLDGVNIAPESTAAPLLIGEDAHNVTIVLSGENVLDATNTTGGNAGLQKDSGSTYSLTITSADGDGETSGTLIAKGGVDETGENGGAAGGAGIGGNFISGGANIIINGGTIEATGGSMYVTGANFGAAGIGGGCGNDDDGGSDITINGGDVTATGAYGGAGIGGGCFAGNSSNITINGGTVEAVGSLTDMCALFGSGNIVGSAGIGSGIDGDSSNITINGGTVTATGAGTDQGGAGIGGGACSISKNITINGGDVTATGASGGAGIGNGADPSNGVYYYTDGITITGGTVTATGSSNSYYYGSGIGGGGGSQGKNITISGGYITATPGNSSADAIGSGYNGTAATGVTFTGGYFADNSFIEGENGTGTVYNCAPDSGYAVYANDDETYKCAVASTTDELIISGGAGYTYTSSLLEITDGGAYTVTMNTFAYPAADTATDTIKVSATDNVTLTLDSVNIVPTSTAAPLEISDGTDNTVTVKLKGTNVLDASSTTGGSAGLQKTSTNNTLVITSADGDGETTGTLTATGGTVDEAGGAGIGGSKYGNGNNITIKGGTINATGGAYSAGIGGGDCGNGNNITITGGTVTAKGNSNSAGIGGGGAGSASGITITGGTVNATGGSYGAGIGSGGPGGTAGYSASDITITGGAVTAKGGDYAAGIGGGNRGNGSSITITGGTVDATAGLKAAGIGGGNDANGSDITINGGEVTATGGTEAENGGAGIGGGDSGNGNNITISGGSVTATGGSGGAGIGGGIYGDSSNITISGGSVTATGGYYVDEYEYDDETYYDYYGGAGIGGGYYGDGSGITITGGTVEAKGYYGSAGIGGGYGSEGGSDGSEITITGGTVTAVADAGESGYYGAGIGSGRGSDTAYITISGGNISATAGGDGAEPIGTGYYQNNEPLSLENVNTASIDNVTITGGCFVVGDAEANTVYGVTPEEGYKVYTTEDSDYSYIVVSTTQAFLVDGGSGYDYTDGLLNFTDGGEYTVSMNTYAGFTSTDSETIKISTDGDVTLTLNGVSIENSSKSPLEVDADGDVTVKLSGTNTLTSNNYKYAALQKTSDDNELIITSADGDGETTGTLTATSIKDSVDTGAGSAGIGGGYDAANGSNITIKGGTITALGSWEAAGIGGAYGEKSGDGTNITVTGGDVTAYARIEVEGYIGGNGAGIGGANGGDASDITITGGTVTAYASGGAAIGGGCYGDGTGITIKGGTVTAVGHREDRTDSEGAGIGGGDSGNGYNITIIDGTVTATGGNGSAGIGGGWDGSADNIEISGGYIKATPGSSDAEAIGKGKYGSTSGTITITGGCFAEEYTAGKTTVYGVTPAAGYKVFENTDAETGADYNSKVVYYPNDLTIATDDGAYTYENNLLTITEGGTYTVGMVVAGATTTTDTIKVTASENPVTLTLDGVSIAPTGSVPPLEIDAESDVTVKLSGANTLDASDTSNNDDTDYAGLQKTSTDNVLTITCETDDETDSLTATGGDYAAGIGGGYYDGGDSDDYGGNGSNIIINGGTVTAKGDSGAAGIGGGRFGNGSNITINGGIVTASCSGNSGAGIGGSYKGNGTYITINGGEVTATGGGGAAGIGGGYNGSGSNITITAGTVNATGGGGTYVGAGIGGGYYGSGSDITISGGYITATPGDSSAAAIGKGSSGSTGTVTITGGYFADSYAEDQTTVYGITPAENYAVYANAEDSKDTYECRVASTKLYVTYADISETEGVTVDEDLGVTKDDTAYTYNDPITVSTDLPYTYNGYKQIGWSLSKDGTDDSDVVTWFNIYDDTTLYPVFARAFTAVEDEDKPEDSADIELTYGVEANVALKDYLTFVDDSFSTDDLTFVLAEYSSLPTGLKLENGVLTGTPEVAHEDGTVIFTVTDSAPTYLTLASLDPDPAAIIGTLTLTITIAKAEQAAPTGYTVTQPSAETSSNGTITDVTTYMEYSTDGGENWTAVTGDSITADPGEVLLRYAETENYNASESVKITIDAADPSYTVPKAIENLVYDGREQELVEAGDVTGGTMHYSLTGEDDDWSENVPTAVDAGTYYVYYKIVGADNYNDLSFDTPIEVKIAQATPEYEIPSGLTATYGDTLADVTLPDGWTWDNDAQSVGNVGDNEFSATYSIDDANYEDITETLTVTVEKAEPTYTVPSGLTATYGQTLADVDLPNGWTWDNDAQSVGDVGTNTFKATYSTGDANYEDVTVEVEITVTEASEPTTEPIELTVEETPSASRVKKGKTLSASTLSGGVVTADGVEVSGSWSWADGDETMSKTGTYERTAVFTAEDAAYGTVEATVSVKVYTATTGGGSSSGSNDSSSTDSSGTTAYAVSTESATADLDGTISADTSTATAGDTVTITVTPDEGYEVETVTVTDADGNEIEVTANDDGIYAFVMPATAVSVSATFTESDGTSDGDNADGDGTSGTHVCPSEKFADVDTSLWYHEYIDYALENGLMTGTSSEDFEPNTATTRGMIVTILYRLEGEPTATAASDFVDVVSGAWYADAVAWAAENGIVKGYDNGKFGANDTITREQTAAILYRYAGYKGYDTTADGDISAYTDADAVSDYAVTAMQWAVGTGLITGKDNNTLAPQAGATRAETAAMLARFIEAE